MLGTLLKGKSSIPLFVRFEREVDEIEFFGFLSIATY